MTSLLVNVKRGCLATYAADYPALGKQAAALQTEIASASARQIHHFVSRKVERLRDAGVFMTRYPIGSEDQRLIGLLLLKNDPAFRQISILDSQGMERIKSSEILAFLPSDLQNRSGETAYTKAIREKPSVS